jgi:hypothetical protein
MPLVICTPGHAVPWELLARSAAAQGRENRLKRVDYRPRNGHSQHSAARAQEPPRPAILALGNVRCPAPRLVDLEIAQRCAQDRHIYTAPVGAANEVAVNMLSFGRAPVLDIKQDRGGAV